MLKPLQDLALDDDVAISVEGVSKNYGLWSSPGARIRYEMMRLGRHLVPSSAAQSMEASMAAAYREFHALQDVSFQVKKGESWGVIGVNGSGKSTLLKMVAGKLRPSAGRVVVDGKVALLDYSSGLHGDFTGKENIYLKSAIMGMSRREIEAKYDSIVAFADIGEFINQPVKTYSSGMSARLGFAILAHTESDIIISDEALAVGDAFFVQKCMSFIHNFLKKGTFLFVTHATGDVVSLCEKAVWLENGRIRAIGPAKTVCDGYLSQRDAIHSAAYLTAQKAPHELHNGEGDAEAPDAIQGSVRKISSRIRIDAGKIAQIQQHLAPPKTRPELHRSAFAAMDVSSNLTAESVLAGGRGVGGGRIIGVHLLDADGNAICSVLGGELVRLRIECLAEKSIQRAIIGFQLINNRGLTLFANNTSGIAEHKPITAEPNQIISAEIRFYMPILQQGDYVMRVGLADGFEASSALLDVQAEALVITCKTSSTRHGLVSVPLDFVEMTIYDDSRVKGVLCEND